MQAWGRLSEGERQSGLPRFLEGRRKAFRGWCINETITARGIHRPLTVAAPFQSRGSVPTVLSATAQRLGEANEQLNDKGELWSP